MKKGNKILLIGIASIMIAFMYRSHIESAGFAQSYTAKEDVVVSYGSNIECQIDGNVHNMYADMVESELERIPAALRSKFVEDGWHIYVTDENLAHEYYRGQYTFVYGSTFYKKDLILMYANEKAIKDATVHEFGHWLDDYLGDVSETKKFKAIYKEEREAFMNEFYRNNDTGVREYFAEAFYNYIKYIFIYELLCWRGNARLKRQKFYFSVFFLYVYKTYF